MWQLCRGMTKISSKIYLGTLSFHLTADFFKSLLLTRSPNLTAQNRWPAVFNLHTINYLICFKCQPTLLLTDTPFQRWWVWYLTSSYHQVFVIVILESLNHRMFWVERDLRDLVPAPLPGAETPSTKLSCYKYL